MSPPGSSASDPGAGEALTPASPTPNIVNIFDSVPPEADLTYTQQSPEQRSHVREMDRLKELHRQRIEVCTLWITFGVFIVIVAACLVIFFKTTNPDIQKIAAGGLVSILAAWIGYAAGKNQRSG